MGEHAPPKNGDIKGLAAILSVKDKISQYFCLNMLVIVNVYFLIIKVKLKITIVFFSQIFKGVTPLII